MRRLAAWHLVVDAATTSLDDGGRRQVAPGRTEVEAGQRDDGDAEAHRNAEPERHPDAQAGERPWAGGDGDPGRARDLVVDRRQVGAVARLDQRAAMARLV